MLSELECVNQHELSKSECRNDLSRGSHCRGCLVTDASLVWLYMHTRVGISVVVGINGRYLPIRIILTKCNIFQWTLSRRKLRISSIRINARYVLVHVHEILHLKVQTTKSA